MSDGLVWLLGMRVDAEAVRSYLRSLGPTEELTMEDIPDHYTTVPSAGLDLVSTDDGIVDAVILYDTNSWPLPLGLAMSMGQAEVRALLGKPQVARKATESPLLGRVAPGDRYDTPGFSVALDYDEETGRIRMVQLIRPEAVPRRPVEQPRSRRRRVMRTLGASLAAGAFAGGLALGWAPPKVGLAVGAVAAIAAGLRMRYLRRRQDGE